MNAITLQDAISEYLTHGFGTMTKNDFEVWIFNYLLQNELQGKSDNAISRELRIPSAKVKRLRYEADLKYQHDDKYYKDCFYHILKNRMYKRVDNNRIQFSIPDKTLRLYLDDILESNGSYADSSFNTNIVTITATDLLLLIAKFENKKELVDIVRESLISTEKNLPEIIREKLIKGTEAVIRDLGLCAPNVTDFLIDCFKNNSIKIKE